MNDRDLWYIERGWAFDAAMDYSIDLACQPWYKRLWRRLTDDYDAEILSRKCNYINENGEIIQQTATFYGFHSRM